VIKTNKISNLKRLDFKNIIIVILYFVKKIFKLKTSFEEESCYEYYNILIKNNGYLKEETNEYYISVFKNLQLKKIKTRKRPSSDIDVFKQVYGWNSYYEVIKLYKENFKFQNEIPLNIIDAGSNIGLTSLYFADYFINQNIIAIEPETENFKVLDFNLSNKNCIKINGAIWKNNSKIKIVKDFRDKLDWSFRVEETIDKNAIDAFSINQLVLDYKFQTIDILKIDVEGSEKEIFTSENSNLDFLKITKCIAIEIHDEFNCRKEIYKVLTYFGFSFFESGETTIGVNKNLIL
jgi:FkbM family methyltransferase